MLGASAQVRQVRHPGLTGVDGGGRDVGSASMAIRVAPGATDVIRDYADGFVVHVTDADDVDAACHALALVRGDIAELTAERSLSIA